MKLEEAIDEIKNACGPLDFKLGYANGREVGAELLAQSLEVARVTLILGVNNNIIGEAGAGFLAEAIKVAQVPLILSLGYKRMGIVGAELLAQSLKVARVPLTLYLADNDIGTTGAGFLAHSLKEAGVPLSLHLSNNGIGDAGAGLFAEAIRCARAPLTLELGGNSIGDVGAGLLAQSLKEARVPLTLDLRGNNIGDDGAELFAQSLKAAQVPLTLYLSYNQIGEDSVGLFAQAIKEARVPLNLDVRKSGYADEASLCNALKDNFIIDARSDPSKFLSRIEFILSMRMIEQKLGFPSVLTKIVQDYIGNDDLAWIDVAAIRAIEGASNENKYSSINYEVLAATYLMADDGKEERASGNNPVIEQVEEEQYPNASRTEDGAPGSSSSSFSSSSSGSPPPGGGAHDGAELQEQDTASLSGNSKPITLEINQASHGNNKDVSDAETFFKKLFDWIKDTPEELQQQLLSYFSIQQMLKFLEATLNPHKFIEDQLSSAPVEERFESEYKTLYSKYNDVNETDYARASQENSMAIPSLELSGKDFSHGIVTPMDSSL